MEVLRRGRKTKSREYRGLRVCDRRGAAGGDSKPRAFFAGHLHGSARTRCRLEDGFPESDTPTLAGRPHVGDMPASLSLHEVPYDFWRPTTFALHDFARRNGLVVVEEYRAGDGWDVLGTVLTVTGFSGPAGPCGTLLGVFGKAMKRLALMATSSRWLRRMLHCRSELYLSNVAVFTKPMPADAPAAVAALSDSDGRAGK